MITKYLLYLSFNFMNEGG